MPLDEAAPVLFEDRGHLALIILNRPEAMNAVNQQVATALTACLDRYEADPQLWCAIICSRHPTVFCAGADLKAVHKGQRLGTKKGGFAGLVRYPRTKPLIAAVDGAALAGGFEICLASDLIVCSSSSKFGLPEVKRSLLAAGGGVFRLPERIPRNVAMEMLMTGEPITAARAYHFGLVSALVESGGALDAAIELAGRITANPPLAVQEVKACMDSIQDQGLDETGAFARSNKGLKNLALTADYREGPLAFIEKRAPVWTGLKLSKL